SGTHIIAAPIGGTNGLAKDGLGTLVLAGNNSYSGLTDVQKGELRITNSASINGTVNVAAGASFFFEGDLQGGGFDGTFAPNITGAGRVELGSLLTTQTVTFDSAKSYSGQTRIA